MDPSRAQGYDSLVIEEELVHRTLGWWMGAEGGVFLKAVPEKRSNAALRHGQRLRVRANRPAGSQRGHVDKTHIIVPGPKQLLGSVEGEGCDGCGHRLPARWREQLTTQLQRTPSG